jgi:hypothetical protein
MVDPDLMSGENSTTSATDGAFNKEPVKDGKMSM